MQETNYHGYQWTSELFSLSCKVFWIQERSKFYKLVFDMFAENLQILKTIAIILCEMFPDVVSYIKSMHACRLLFDEYFFKGL